MEKEAKANIKEEKKVEQKKPVATKKEVDRKAFEERKLKAINMMSDGFLADKLAKSLMARR